MTDYFSTKRVVVTGGTGFLGSHVADALRHRCAEVHAIGTKDYDLVEVGEVARMVRELRPQVLIHLAARVGGIGANSRNPGLFFYQNAQMGIALLEEARKAEVEKVIVAGTICSYPKFAPIPFREEDLWNGYPEETNAPYGLAKKMLLVQCQAYRQQYGMNAVMVLPVNLYGPRDHFDLENSHVIPALIHKCEDAILEGRDEIVLWGDGSPTREFLYVEDAARGIILATERYSGADPLNLGTSQEISIADLAEKIKKHSGFEGRIRWDESRPNGQPRRCLDVSRAARELGFEAQVDLDTGIARTIQWYRQDGPSAKRAEVSGRSQ